MIDVILLGWIFYLFLNGWHKGAMCTLISPLSLILGVLSSILYFQKTHNAIGLFIGLLAAPLGFAILLSLIITAWHEKVNKSLPPEPLSRIIGAVSNVLWGGSIFIFAMMSIPPLSMQIPQLDGMKQKILASYSYAFIQGRFAGKIPLLRDVEALSIISKDEKKLEEFQSRPEVSALSKDEKIKDIVSDEELMKQIQQKDIFKILSNKKIQQALQDEQLIEKILALRKFTFEEKSSSPPPKVYEFK